MQNGMVEFTSGMCKEKNHRKGVLILWKEIQGNKGKQQVLQPFLLCKLQKEGIRMNDDLRNRIQSYRTAVSVMKEMFHNGIISDEEMAVIQTKLLEKYGLNSCSIFR